MTLSLVEYRLSLEEARGVAEVSHIVLPYREFPESVPCPRVCPIDERPSLSFKVRYHGVEPVLLMKGARTSCINQEAARTIEKAISLPDEQASD